MLKYRKELVRIEVGLIRLRTTSNQVIVVHVRAGIEWKRGVDNELKHMTSLIP